ncbi:DUF302 domain-containing protein [Vibrio pectenicida]|uniref:DUF302 domain-containing protein n=1 Tax=Vibrio pectenicida TaxID=62763 RepID=UPI003B99C0CC
MFKTATAILSVSMLSFYTWAEDSVIKLSSPHSVTHTTNQFVANIQEKGFNVFARVNHQENAEKINMSLRPTEVVIFGKPKVGTKLMQCAQEVAIDLPQKALIYEDDKGKTWIAYNNPMYLKKRHDIEGCDKILTKISGVLNSLASQSAK